MSRMKEFRSIADDVMQDISASDALKEKTLKGCLEKRQVPITRFLVPAACFVLILGLVSVSGMLPLKNQPGVTEMPNDMMMAATGDNRKLQPELSGVSTLSEPGTVEVWQLETLNEAEKCFGSSFMEPSYIPDSFKPGKIHAYGRENAADRVVLEFTSGDQSFLIIEEKTGLQNEFHNYNKIDINGAEGYLKSAVTGAGDNAGGPDTEVHWFGDGIHYTVAGLIDENDAVKVARSME